MGLAPWAIMAGVCGCIDRDVGQIELFGVGGTEMTLCRYLSEGADTGSEPATVVSGWGDRIRSNDNVVTIQVQSAHLENLPLTLTGSRDVILFAEVQENAAAGYDMEKNKPLTTVVFVGRNQKLPGLLNFQGALAYGPTLFKGHPLKIKFTLLVLQKERAEQMAAVVGLIGSIVGTAAPQYAGIVSEVVNIIRAILLAQPDVAAFDFETTFLSDMPEGFKEIIPTTRIEGIETAPGWDARVPWLRYGFFALVETKGRYALKPTRGTEGKMTLDGGRLLDASRQPLATNYLVFSVTPGQLAEEDATLAAASKINDELLQALRRPPVSIVQTIEEIEKYAVNLTGAIMQARAEAEARKAGQRAQARGQGFDSFESDFDSAWSVLTKGLDDKNKALADTVANVVKQRWAQKQGWATDK